MCPPSKNNNNKKKITFVCIEKLLIFDYVIVFSKMV